jgi:hypothetical protein
MKHAMSALLFVLLSSLISSRVDGASNTVWHDPLLRLYDPSNATPPYIGTEGWADCIDTATYRFPVATDAAGQLKEMCQPDTVYSWGGSKKLEVFREFSSGACEEDKCFTRPIFTHINPITTFGFGDIQLRIKLKPGTRFEITRLGFSNNAPWFSCEAWSKDRRENTISIQIWKADVNDGIGVDYVLCSPGPIQSWSVWTRDGYDEIVNAQLWLNNNTNVRDWLPWSRSLRTGEEDMYANGSGTLGFTHERLKNDLLNWRGAVERKEGGVYYPPNAAPSDPAAHFSTARKVYWNWK